MPGLISLSFRGKDGETIMHRMELKGIMISIDAACDSSNTKVSYVIEAIGLSNEFSKGTIRISFGKRTTHDEVETVASTLINVLK